MELGPSRPSAQLGAKLERPELGELRPDLFITHLGGTPDHPPGFAAGVCSALRRCVREGRRGLSAFAEHIRGFCTLTAPYSRGKVGGAGTRCPLSPQAGWDELYLPASINGRTEGWKRGRREGKGKESFNWDVDSGGVLRECWDGAGSGAGAGFHPPLP